MKQRDKTERTMREEMNVTVVMSKAELRTGDAVMNNMDRSNLGRFRSLLFMFLVMCQHKCELVGGGGGG